MRRCALTRPCCFQVGTRLRLCPHLCRDRRTTQVWLCVFVLSTATFIAFHSPMRPENALIFAPLQESRAMLYAPSMNDIQCHLLSLKCYFLELVMVMDEEEVDGDNIYGNCLHDFNEALLPKDDAVSCPPCEAHSQGNITTFLDRLKTLLQAVTL
uniref:Interleukin n=1 Tax=Hippocampus comes TaxID=109280 RepID=A0A3Q3D6B4_HIPCM